MEASKDHSSLHESPSAMPAARSPSAYNGSLVFAFLSNSSQMVAVSLLFRYSDFVENCGGTEYDLGWITGIAAVGAILLRTVHAPIIDRFGPSAIWLCAIGGQIAALLWHQFIARVDSWEVYLALGLYQTCLAGTFGAWLSLISLQVSKNRLAEVLGVIGASGFIGMATGPQVGDWIFCDGVNDVSVNLMFWGALGFTLVAGLLAAASCWLAVFRTDDASVEAVVSTSVTAGSASVESTSHVWLLVRRYHPGTLLLVGMLMGLLIGFAPTYLRPFAEDRNIADIGSFFLAYNVVAFATRIAFRRAPDVIGIKKTIGLGLFFSSCSLPLYLVVHTQSMLWLPGAMMGLGHSFLYPSVVAGCQLAFPRRNRGVATNLILAMYDTGRLIGFPIIGWIVTVCKERSWPAYTIAVGFVLALIATIGILFGAVYEQRNADDQRNADETSTGETAKS